MHAEEAVASRFRGVLFAPGNRAEVVAKLPRVGADVGVIDLEDAVPAGEKANAREIAVKALLELRGDGSPHRTDPAQTPPGRRGSQRLYMRVNPARSTWFEADVLAATGAGVDGLVLPKAEDPSDLETLGQLLGVHGRPGMAVVAGLETVAGVVRADEMCRQASKVNLVAVYFGAEDYIADLGGQRTTDGLEVLYARSRVAIAARLAGIAAIDQAVVDLRSPDAFEQDARQGRALGYTGKLCVHPSQVPLAQTVFRPSPQEVKRAGDVLAALDEGVTVFDGQMVDEAHARRARATLAQATEQ